jgi:hypothetical protein
METVRRRKRSDGVTEREIDGNEIREKKEKERKQTHVEIG